MIAIKTAQPYDEPPRTLAGYDPLRDADGYEWSPKHARHIVGFYRDCLIITGGKNAGQPFTLEKWQADYLATLNGWRDSRGLRRYRETLFATPRKNGKTETGAGLALFGLCQDGEQRAQVYSAAKTREQASMVFEPAAIMAKKSNVLISRMEVIPSRKRIAFPSTNSYYQAIAADAGAIHGTKPHLVLFDELHTQTTRELYDTLKSGMGAGEQPLFCSMTTAGHSRESICWEVWTHAQKVRDGLADPTFLPLIYETPPEADWKSEDVWRACNPNLGVTVKLEFLRDECRRAQETPAYENTFRNLYLNQWTEQACRWLPMDRWDACNSVQVTEADLYGRECWAGLDLSTTTDLTALALIFPLDNGLFAVLCRFWRPEDGTDQASKRDRVNYREWARRGLLSLTPGNVVDYDYIRHEILSLADRFSIQEIAFDPWNATQLMTQLQGEGMKGAECRPGYYSMSGPSKEFEKLVVGGTLVHLGNPILRWMASNVAIEQDVAGNIRPTKAQSSGRIDGIVAAIMATGRAVTSPASSYTYYERNQLEIG